MGAIFGVIFFIWLLIVGLSGIELSIAGIIVSSIFSKKGKRFAKPLKVVSIILLTFCALITLIPTGYFSFIFVANTMPPEDYVETEITIEENGYQDERFTADGKVYEVIDLYVNNEDYLDNPIYSYKTSGLLNGSQCGNYYAVENTNNFDLVCDWFGLLFAPIDEKQEVLDYYLSIENQDYYYYDYSKEESILIDENFTKSLNEFLSKDLSNEDAITSSLEDIDSYDIDVISSDKLIYVTSYYFVYLNDSMYYIYESTFIEDVGFEHTLILLDEQLKTHFINIIENI